MFQDEGIGVPSLTRLLEKANHSKTRTLAHKGQYEYAQVLPWAGAIDCSRTTAEVHHTVTDRYPDPIRL